MSGHAGNDGDFVIRIQLGRVCSSLRIIDHLNDPALA